MVEWKHADPKRGWRTSSKSRIAEQLSTECHSEPDNKPSGHQETNDDSEENALTHVGRERPMRKPLFPVFVPGGVFASGTKNYAEKD